MNELVYMVDERDRLIYVNPAWELFALENDAPELTAHSVLGRPLLDFIHGAESKHMTSMLLRRVRAAGSAIVVPFRCDSSSQRRELEMVVTPIDGCVEFRTRVSRSLPRRPIPLLTRGRPRTDELLTLCSWCNRVKVFDQWVELEDAAQVLGLFERPILPTLTHGICTRCVEHVFQ